MQIKNKTFRLTALALSLGGAFLVSGDSINGAGGSLNSWNGVNLVVNSSSSGIGTPYWNNISGDGDSSNVGWCILGGGACSPSTGSPGSRLQYFGNGNNSVPDMYFTSTGSSLALTLETVLTSQKTTPLGYDVFGYYVANGAGAAPGTASLVPLFDSRTNAAGSSMNIAIPAGDNYGFYIENIKGGGTANETDYFYLMDSASNVDTRAGGMPADSLQHFVAFQGTSNNWWVGDVNATECQGSFTPSGSGCIAADQFDYQDMLVQVAAVPEPAPIALLGGGLVLFGLIVRKRKTGSTNA